MRKTQLLVYPLIVWWSVFLMSNCGAVDGSLSVSVYGVANEFSPDLSSELIQFTAAGGILQQSDASETRHGLSLATNGGSLFVAEFGGAINEYDLLGNYLGEFADVSPQAGTLPSSPKLESDLQGNLFVSYGGQSSTPRTSFRLDSTGSISASFRHPELVFPRGIDADGDGDVYIVNSAAVGIGNRLFQFDERGGYIADYAIDEVQTPSDLAVNELTNELFLADEFGDAIHVYDLSSGGPVYTESITLSKRVLDVFVEPHSGRMFGVFFAVDPDLNFPQSFQFTGFEVNRDGSLVSEFREPSTSGKQSIRGLVAIPIPEPSASLLAVAAVSLLLSGRRRR